MTNSQRLATVREAFACWIANQDDSVVSDDTSSEFSKTRESMLIRDGFYCGRRFKSAEFRAVWFFEEDEMKVFSVASGERLDRLVGDEISAMAESKPMILQMTPPILSQESAEEEKSETRRAA